MDYILIKHSDMRGRYETHRYPTKQRGADEVLYEMIWLYVYLNENNPKPEKTESREVKSKWYLDIINEFCNSLTIEKQGDEYRYSFTIEDTTKEHALTTYEHDTIYTYGGKVTIWTQYMSLEEGLESDLFKFEKLLYDPKFYLYNSKRITWSIINDWTFEEEKLIYGILSKRINTAIALSTFLNDYVKSLRKMVRSLKDDKISKKLIGRLSRINLKHMWKYDNIKDYCKIFSKLYGNKKEDLPSHVDTNYIYGFISYYETLSKFFTNHISQNLIHKCIEILFSNVLKKIKMKTEILRYVIDNYGEELTDEFLKILN